nr:MAG TPA: hypothetical protein [Caudoviricetes sp.]
MRSTSSRYISFFRRTRRIKFNFRLVRVTRTFY